MEPIIVEIRLSPSTEALLKSFAPRSVNGTQQLPQSPAEQAARMRMQPVPTPQRPAPTYAPTPQQYQPQPASAPTAPYAPVAPMARPTTQQQPPRPASPTPVPPAGPVAAVPTAPMPAGQSTAQPAAVPSKPVPVADAPTYELDQLARATATLADAGKMQQIQQLFQQFGIQQLTTLPKDRYGEYATTLRQMGVRI